MDIVAIIPAYNEEKTIADIINVLKKIDKIKSILVVSDGSTDKTAIISKKSGAKVIELPKNIGKGGAMSVGVKNSNEDIIMFLDADLLGLTKDHIDTLIEPVLEGSYEMTVGVFKNGKILTDIGLKTCPFLSGQRVIKRAVFSKIKDIDESRFGVEMILTNYIIKNNIPYLNVSLNKLSHVFKERKMGFFKGLLMRLKMFQQIIMVLLINIIK